MVWQSLCTEWNEACSILAKNSVVEMTESIRERPELEHHLWAEKVQGYLWSYLAERLALTWAFSCVSNED